MPADSSGEDLLSASRTAVFSLCPHVADGTRELSGVCFIRALVLFMRTPL